MKAIVQRVSRAEVRVGPETVGAIGAGLVALVGVTHSDSAASAHRLAAKIARLRIFDVEGGQSSIDEISDVSAAVGVLVISQFTLYGDTRKGRRPSWGAAAPGEAAEPLVDEVVAELQRLGVYVQTGRFGAMMDVELVNHGPVTLTIEVD